MCMGEPGARRFATREAFERLLGSQPRRAVHKHFIMQRKQLLGINRVAASTPADMQVSADRPLAADKDAA